jgi:hypothetical protein
MNLDISPELQATLDSLETILNGKAQFTSEDKRQWGYPLASDNDFRVVVFKQNTGRLLADLKSDGRTFEKAFRYIVVMADKNDFGGIIQELYAVKDYVLTHDLSPNLDESNPPNNKPNNRHNKPARINWSLDSVKDIFLGRETWRGVISNGYVIIILSITGGGISLSIWWDRICSIFTTLIEYVKIIMAIIKIVG